MYLSATKGEQVKGEKGALAQRIEKKLAVSEDLWNERRETGLQSMVIYHGNGRGKVLHRLLSEIPVRRMQPACQEQNRSPIPSPLPKTGILEHVAAVYPFCGKGQVCRHNRSGPHRLR